MPESFESAGLSVQEKQKIYFQDGHLGPHLGFPIGTILANFDLHVALMFLTKFRVSWPLGSEKKQKIDFQDGHHGGHLGFPIGTILAISVLQVTLMLNTKFRVS